MKRTFIAADILPDPGLKEIIEQIHYRLRYEKINWAQTDLMHITLNFLGDTEDNLLPGIINSIESITDGFDPFDLVLKSIGIFKNIRDPRVLWIGCEKSTAIENLKNKIDTIMKILGFDVEKRMFSPHATLGRIKALRQVNQLNQIITQYMDTIFQNHKIDHVVFYESILKPEGAEYIPLRKFYLAHANR
jgi:RNA 2',3'-cyclic 3'-phosphodiesterase